MNPIKKASFNELYETFTCVLSKIDELFINYKCVMEEKNNKCIWNDTEYNSFDEFIRGVERESIKYTSEKTGLSDTAVRERWKIMTCPLPVWDAIEHGELSLTKAKSLISISLDPFSKHDEEWVGKIIEKIKDMGCKEIKELVKQESSTKIWNKSDIVMIRLAGQHRISTC